MYITYEYLRIELIILDKNNWKHSTVCKQIIDIKYIY